jgi:hypothetical protein
MAVFFQRAGKAAQQARTIGSRAARPESEGSGGTVAGSVDFTLSGSLERRTVRCSGARVIRLQI